MAMLSGKMRHHTSRSTCPDELAHSAQVIPSGQSLIADYYADSSRGKAFGGLFLTGAVGGMLGSLYATNLGELLGVWHVHCACSECSSAPSCAQ